MQDCSRSIGGLTKSGAGPRRWPSLALGAVSVIPIVLAIGGGACSYADALICSGGGTIRD
jgi:hypothetical protein